jgi:hypothetical protein
MLEDFRLSAERKIFTLASDINRGLKKYGF